MYKNRFWASKNTFCNGKTQKLFFIFSTPKPCYSREEFAGSALACARGHPGNTPVLAENDQNLASAPKMSGKISARNGSKHTF